MSLRITNAWWNLEKCTAQVSPENYHSEGSTICDSEIVSKDPKLGNSWRTGQLHLHKHFASTPVGLRAFLSIQNGQSERSQSLGHKGSKSPWPPVLPSSVKLLFFPRDGWPWKHTSLQRTSTCRWLIPSRRVWPHVHCRSEWSNALIVEHTQYQSFQAGTIVAEVMLPPHPGGG